MCYSPKKAHMNMINIAMAVGFLQTEIFALYANIPGKFNFPFYCPMPCSMCMGKGTRELSLSLRMCVIYVNICST